MLNNVFSRHTMLVGGQYAGQSRYVAIEESHPQASVEVSQRAHAPMSSRPVCHRHAAIEAPPMAPNVPGNALAPVNKFLPIGAGNSAMLYASSPQQCGSTPGDLQLATAQSALAHDEWGVSPSNRVEAAMPQRDNWMPPLYRCNRLQESLRNYSSRRLLHLPRGTQQQAKSSCTESKTSTNSLHVARIVGTHRSDLYLGVIKIAA